jgi:hypothetical protein
MKRISTVFAHIVTAVNSVSPALLRILVNAPVVEQVLIWIVMEPVFHAQIAVNNAVVRQTSNALNVQMATKFLMTHLLNRDIVSLFVIDVAEAVEVRTRLIVYYVLEWNFHFRDFVKIFVLQAIMVIFIR